MSKGLVKIVDEVFKFPEFCHDGPKLTGWFIPHAAVDQPSGGPSLTRQDQADECDINNIMAKYEATGYLPSVAGRAPVYVDFASVPDNMMDAMAHMHAATDAFMTLPASIRKEFDNDPAFFVDYASNPENLDQLREWGLASPAPKPAPVPAEESAGAPSPAPSQAPSGAAHS